MRPLQLNEEEKGALDAMDDRHTAAKAAMRDFFDEYIKIQEEIADEAHELQIGVIQKYGLDPELDYKVEKETGIMSEYTEEQQKEDGVWEMNRKSEMSTEEGTLDWGEIDKFLKDDKGNNKLN